MSDEEALLAAICADPADDTARLVFADFLQEQGGKVEAAWAMFVRAHVRLGTGVETAGDVPTVQRLGKDYWLTQFAERLGFPVGSGVALADWERGFPNHLSAEYPVARERWGFPASGGRVLLIYGGSQGSAAINRVVASWIDNGLPNDL